MEAPGVPHHIIGRGMERREIFFDGGDRDDFLRRMGKIAAERQTRCYAWVLIPNHFHLLLKAGDVPVATVMRRLLTGCAGGLNRRHQRSGHLVRNRYKSFSFFEAHTDIIEKGTRETTYGHKVFVAGGSSGLILACLIECGNPADSAMFLALLERQKGLNGRPPCTYVRSTNMKHGVSGCTRAIVTTSSIPCGKG